MQYWYTFFVLFFAVGLAVLIVHCAVNAVAKHSPKILAGVEGGASNLTAALSASVPYSIIEIAPGVHEGAGWTGLHLPAHPVLITSPDGGRSRACTLRDASSQLLPSPVYGLRFFDLSSYQMVQEVTE